jgi:hypothetical protein
MKFKKYARIIVASVGSIIHLINDARLHILETSLSTVNLENAEDLS